MKTFDAATWRAARRALEKAVALHLDDPNVTHIDIGYRTLSREHHRLEPELAVRVHLREKLSGEDFKIFADREPDRVITAERLGFTVDIPVATYRQHLQWQPQTQRVEFHRELRGGISISNAESYGFATLGGKVRNRQNGEEMILSNWHVLAGSWLNAPGLRICQPALGDDGEETDDVATYVRHAMEANLDAAVARLNGKRPLRNEQLEIGAVTGVAKPQLGMKVIKSGRSTGVTTGIISGVEGYAMHSYGNGRLGEFETKYMIRHIVHIAPEPPEKPVSAPGDSGSWWLEEVTRRATALHFAGSDDPEFALALSMPEVLEALNVDIAK